MYVFLDLLYKSITIFIDDFNIQSSKMLYHDYIHINFQWCRKAWIAFNHNKIFLAVQKRVLFGYLLLKKNRKSDPKKIKVIVELILSLSIRKVQQTLDHIRWYYEIYNYASTSILIIKLQQKDVKFE